MLRLLTVTAETLPLWRDPAARAPLADRVLVRSTPSRITVHDDPACAVAARSADRVVPVAAVADLAEQTLGTVQMVAGCPVCGTDALVAAVAAGFGVYAEAGLVVDDLREGSREDDPWAHANAREHLDPQWAFLGQNLAESLRGDLGAAVASPWVGTVPTEDWFAAVTACLSREAAQAVASIPPLAETVSAGPRSRYLVVSSGLAANAMSSLYRLHPVASHPTVRHLPAVFLVPEELREGVVRETTGWNTRGAWFIEVSPDSFELARDRDLWPTLLAAVADLDQDGNRDGAVDALLAALTVPSPGATT